MKIIDLTKKNVDIDTLLKQAVNAIKNGNLVIFPTETVYGLGADCFNPEAVNKIFIVKNRPYSDPLIVHVSNFEQLKKIVKKIPEKVKKIIDMFWPGPVSLVLKKTKLVPDIVTAGLDTVAVRMPANEVALKFINMCGVPLAAPSANIFSRTSATAIEHIIEDFKNSKEVKYVIYTGKSEFGIESTVLDCITYPFKVLRHGALDVETIVKKTKVKIVEIKNIKIKKSPGMFKKHYAPLTPAYIVSHPFKFFKKLKSCMFNKYVVVCSNNTEKKLKKYEYKGLVIIPYGNSLKEIAHNLYFCLRLADKMKKEKILIEPVKPTGIGKAIMDRIIKATENRWI